MKIIRLTDMWVRGELARTPDGRRALEHYAMAQVGKTTKIRRHHNRAAQRIARRVLSPGGPS